MSTASQRRSGGQAHRGSPRVAYICADQGIRVFARKGGASWHVQEFLRALLRTGARVDLFTPRPGGSPGVDLVPVRVHQMTRPDKMTRVEREQQALGANEELRRALEDSGPFDLVYERYSLWSSAGMAYAEAHGVPGLLEVNSPLIDERGRYGMLFDRASAARVAKQVFRTATQVLAVSDGVAAWVRRSTKAPHRVLVVPNGVDPDRFRSNPRGADVDACFTIGFVGTLKPWHGLEDLVRAFAVLYASDPSYRLLIVGDGPERERLLDEVHSRWLDEAVVFTGAVDPAEVPDLLRSMDVAVAPYSAAVDPYFSPLKLFEYFAAGLPVVASDGGQISQLIVNGQTGVLCPAGDPAALASALAGLRSLPEVRRALGEAGRAMVLAGHTWDGIVRRVLALGGLTSPAIAREVA